MRAREFINETKKDTKIAKRHQEPTRGLHKVSDNFSKMNDFGSDYTLYRLMMATACTDGNSEPDLDSKSWIGMAKANFPYSQADQDKLIKAYKKLGVKYQDLNKGDLKSSELDSTNTTSPIPNWTKTNEAASVGATSSGSIASVVNPHLSPGPARGKKSYTGSPGRSGTKSPPQPKPKLQPVGTNALDLDSSLFGNSLPIKRNKK